MTTIDLNGKTDREILMLLVQAMNNVNERLDKINGNCFRHDCRLGALENWRSSVLGVVGLAIVLIPVLTALTLKAFR